MRTDLRLDAVAGQGRKGMVGAVALCLIVLGVLLFQGGGEEAQPDARPTASAADETDPASGLPYVDADSLPPEAGETLRRIDAGGPYPYPENDDQTFHNFEGILPDEPDGHYREYTVETPGLDHRGARRIVTGEGGELYWTDDHYESFSVIVR